MVIQDGWQVAINKEYCWNCEKTIQLTEQYWESFDPDCLSDADGNMTFDAGRGCECFDCHVS